LYNFYQKILDKTGHHKVKSDVGHPQEDIKEEIVEERPALTARDKLDESDPDVDGLIKWAKNLPDDIPNTSQSSFFQKFT
jgi:hypothetical protein